MTVYRVGAEQAEVLPSEGLQAGAPMARGTVIPAPGALCHAVAEDRETALCGREVTLSLLDGPPFGEAGTIDYCPACATLAAVSLVDPEGGADR